MSGYLIRQPTAQEVNKLFDLQNPFSQRVQTLHELIEFYTVFPDGFYVCASGHSLLGFVTSEIWDTNVLTPRTHYSAHTISQVHDPKGTMACISNLTVAAPYYLQVVGYRLVEHLMNEISYRKRQVTSFCSIVDQTNEHVNGFYKKNRFQHVRDREQYSIYHRSIKNQNG